MMIEEMVKQSRIAQEILEKSNQGQIDVYVRAIGKIIYDHAEELAKEAVEETRMGVYEDKVLKNRGKSKMIWWSLKNKKSVGIIGHDEKKGIAYLAKPKGVVGAITPTTNPIVTPMCNAMFAIKGRNSIIISPHPRSKKCSAHAVELMNQELKRLGAPDHLIQIIEEPTMDLSQELMSSVDVVVATGGMGVVRAAYSSGKPAYGVGAGNVQVIVDRGYDFNKAAADIIIGAKFDNGIICSGEQSVIMPKDCEKDVITALEQNGAFYVEKEAEVEKFRQVLFVNGSFNGDLVGQSVQKVGEAAGVPVPPEAKILLLKAKGVGAEDILCKEKLCSCLVALTYDAFEEALDIAKTNLEFEGAGHTAAIHSNDQEHIKKTGEFLPVSRLVVNQPSATGAGGSFYNGFAPTTTLGCGSWGNNSISENFTYKHLINVSQIGYYHQQVENIPTDDEIWE